jgi:MFS family permease
MLITLPMGILTDRYRHRFALLISSVILCLGAAVWANVKFLGGLPTLYIAQTILGLGTGSLGVTRSYVVEQSLFETRTARLARLSSLQYAGFAMTPLIGSFFLFLGRHLAADFRYSLPAYLILFLSLICSGLLYYPFQNIEEKLFAPPSEAEIVINPMMLPTSPPIHNCDEHIAGWGGEDEEHLLAATRNQGSSPRPLSNTMTVRQPLEIDVNSIANCASDDAPASPFPTTPTSRPSSRQTIFLLMIFLNFTTRGCIAVYETEISRILLDNYHIKPLQFGTIITVAGFVGTIQMVYFKQFWSNHFSDYSLMLGGLGLITFSQLLVIPFSALSKEPELWQIVLAVVVMYSFSYPVGNSAILGSFSKIQKTGKQALFQSHFALMGSVARICFPLASGYSETYLIANSSFNLVMISASLSLILIIYWKEQILYYTVSSFEVDQVPVTSWSALQRWQLLSMSLFFLVICLGVYSMSM